MGIVKPCPFCGGTDIDLYKSMNLIGSHKWNFHIYCLSCNIETASGFKRKKEAIKFWNERKKEGE